MYEIAILLFYGNMLGVTYEEKIITILKLDFYIDIAFSETEYSHKNE